MRAILAGLFSFWIVDKNLGTQLATSCNLINLHYNRSKSLKSEIFKARGLDERSEIINRYSKQLIEKQCFPEIGTFTKEVFINHPTLCSRKQRGQKRSSIDGMS